MNGKRRFARIRLILAVLLPLFAAGAWLLPASGNDCTAPERQQLTNPGFEAGITGWSIRGTGASATAEQRRCGAASARLAPASGQEVALSQILAASPGQKYQLTGYVARSSDPLPAASISLWWGTSSGTVLATRVTAGAQQGWQQLDMGWLTVPTGVSYLRVTLVASSPTGATLGSVYFDDIALVLAPPPTATPTPSPTPDRTATAAAEAEVYLNEVLTRPASDWNSDGAVNSGDAWIELFAGPSTVLQLQGWMLDDGPGGQSPVALDRMTLHPSTYVVVNAAQTSLSLRSAASLQLLRPDGSIVDSVELPSLAADSSYSRLPDGTGDWSDAWLPTPLERNGISGAVPTPTAISTPAPTAASTASPTATSTPVPTATATPQPSTTPTPTQTPSPAPAPPLVTIREARAALSGTPVRFRGRVTAPPGSTGARRLYVQDETGGVLVVVGEDATRPTVAALVEVTGTGETYYGEQAVRPAENGIRELATGSSVVPRPVRTGSIDESTEGMLVRVEGKITSVSRPNIYVDDGSGEARVRVPATLDWPSPHSGNRISATGVVSSFNGSFRLLPFATSHLVITPEPPAVPPLVSIRMARALPAGSRVRIAGSVTAAPGVLRAGQMYVQDGSGGMLITGRLPELGSGSAVAVDGVRSSYHGERRLKALSVSSLAGVTPPLALRVVSADIGPATEGRLVTLSGIVQSSSWPSFWIGTPAVRVYVPQSHRFPNPRLRRGDTAAVAGIVSQWDGRYRLLLRTPADLSVLRRLGTVYQPVQLAALRRLPLGTAVSFEASVTAAPGVLGRSRAYVGSSTSGIALHLVSGAYPSLKEGDIVRVEGRLDTYQSERIVRLTSSGGVHRIGRGPLLQPLRTTTGGIGPRLEGRLVSVRARITSRQWPALYLDDGSGEARTVALASTGIPILQGGKHDTAAVTGIVSRWRGSWRLLPRRASDIRIQLLPRMPRSGGGGMQSAELILPAGGRSHRRGSCDRARRPDGWYAASTGREGRLSRSRTGRLPRPDAERPARRAAAR